MVQDLGIENEFGCSALNCSGDLFDTLGVEAHGRFDRDAGIVVCADDARVIFVDRPGFVDRIVDDVVVKFFFFDRSVDIGVVDQIAP